MLVAGQGIRVAQFLGIVIPYLWREVVVSRGYIEHAVRTLDTWTSELSWSCLVC